MIWKTNILATKHGRQVMEKKKPSFKNSNGLLLYIIILVHSFNVIVNHSS